MASQRGAKTLLEMYPQLKKGIELAKRDILGHLPAHGNTARSGYKFSTKQLQGVYLNQYYHEPIDKAARMVRIVKKRVKKKLCRDVENVRLYFVASATSRHSQYSSQRLTGRTRIHVGTRRTTSSQADATETSRQRAAKEGFWQEEKEIDTFGKSCRPSIL